MDIDIQAIIEVAAPFVSGLAIAYLTYKRKFKQFRNAVDAVDNALYDDNVTEEEYRDIWGKFRTLFYSKRSGKR